MAVFDMFGNEIKVGDMVILSEQRVQPLKVEGIKEPSIMTNPQAMPMGAVQVTMAAEFPFPQPPGQRNVMMANLMVVKGITGKPQ